MAPVAAKSASKSSKVSKRNLLDDSDSDSDDGGATVGDAFKVNEEYARRFEYNKKREEKQRLEEKYKNNPNAEDDDEDSSSDEEEDEDGFLATEDLDAQISATLQAIRSKDPRVYDGATTFYKVDDNADGATKEKKEKPVYLQDYHREKILAGDVGASDDEDEPAPQTYAQEQDTLRQATVNEFKAAVKGDASESDSDDGFLKPKNKKKADTTATNGVHPSRAAAVKLADLDVKTADKDPETYLSNFMAARAWVEESGTGWKAFESDDDEADNRADEFEQAYNMRFEDPEKSNEVLKSYSRDLANSKSVRREEKSGRKRKRDAEKEQKEEEKRERREEKARLRNLKLEEAEQKLKKIKQAAGAVGKEVTDREWMKFLDEAWENDQWEEEMQKRFGEEYYALDEAANSDDETSSAKKKKAPKKPTWDDDIDINDIVPDFEDEAAIKEKFALTDDEDEAEAQGSASEMDVDEDGGESSSNPKKRKAADHKRARLASQRQSRKERTQLEALVDSKLQLSNHALLDSASSSTTPFRYRETSPQSFGMTARDILLAPSDQVLNEFAGLKKLATFRDVEKKRKDKKRLNKKARLREWRRAAFGKEFESTGPTWGFEGKNGENAAAIAADEQMHESRRKMFSGEQGNVIEPEGEKKKKKRKRSKKEKSGVAEE